MGESHDNIDIIDLVAEYKIVLSEEEIGQGKISLSLLNEKFRLLKKKSLT
jgi:hypothetical protein